MVPERGSPCSGGRGPALTRELASSAPSRTSSEESSIREVMGWLSTLLLVLPWAALCWV